MLVIILFTPFSEPDSQRGEVTCPRSHSQEGEELGLKMG